MALSLEMYFGDAVLGVLRETSVLGLKLAGGGEGRAFVTVVIEGERRDVMKRGVGWFGVSGLVGPMPPLEAVFMGCSRCVCPSRGA